jgi:DNA repair exonuclease SbcCD nuclease subunit
VKIGILGDTQFTNKAPQRRVDNYFQTQMRKFGQALTIFEENRCSCIVQPGDFFDSPGVSNRVKSYVISLLNACFKSGFVAFDKIYCCWGQHDVTGHSKYTLPNSSLAVLEAAEVVKILSEEPVVVGRVSEDDGTRVCLYGAGFGEDIPEPYEDCYNILVTHRMIGDRPLWPGQELVGPRNFLREHPGYNLCICGDYHYRFVEQWNGRTIVNVGALVRKTISEYDLKHKPAVGVFDTSNNSLKIFELEVELVEKVFDLSREVKKQDNSILAELVEKLKQGSGKLLGWKHILSKALDERRSSSDVREIVDKTLEEVKRGKE